MLLAKCGGDPPFKVYRLLKLFMSVYDTSVLFNVCDRKQWVTKWQEATRFSVNTFTFFTRNFSRMSSLLKILLSSLSFVCFSRYQRLKLLTTIRQL